MGNTELNSVSETFMQKPPWHIIVPDTELEYVAKSKLIIVPKEVPVKPKYTGYLISAPIFDDEGQQFNGLVWLPKEVLSSWNLEKFKRDKRTVIDMSPRQFNMECRNTFDIMYGNKLTEEMFTDLLTEYKRKYREAVKAVDAVIDGDDFFYINEESNDIPNDNWFRHDSTVRTDPDISSWMEVGFAQLDTRKGVFGTL